MADKPEELKKSQENDASQSLLEQERQKIISERKDFKDELAKERSSFEAEVAAQKKTLEKEWQALEREKSALNRRTEELARAEIKRDAGYADERQKLDEELQKKRTAFDAEIVELRKSRFAELERHLDEERNVRLAALNKELDDKRKKHAEQAAAEEQEIARRKEELEKREKAVLNKAEETDITRRRLKAHDDAMEKRERELERTVEQRISERKKSFDVELVQAQDECKRLRESIRSEKEKFAYYDELQRRLGGKAPEEVLKELASRAKEIESLRNELVSRPTQEIRNAYERLNSEREMLDREFVRLKEECKTLYEGKREASFYEARIEKLEQENCALAQKKEYFEAEYQRVLDDIKRLQASYKRDEERTERINTIETPYISQERSTETKEGSEIDWLNRLEKSIKEYGFIFPRRLLYAFHTALKTAELSTITVLAGVSGTGKSELPKLYAHFGGFNFLNLPVQPNWDSQESMLGFFNTLDGKFDAQPALRFLAQTQKKKTGDYPFGFSDMMNIILLDEMNLAHVELYFAEFLSKLEERRGVADNDPRFPHLAVKLGSGMSEDYTIPMGKNVLWAGTMNQDETTKSLSDKVLDRGIVINFPRPSELVHRKTGTLPPPAPLLLRTQWDSWKWGAWEQGADAYKDDGIAAYKQFIEQINESLAKVGRSLGHRVWQSVELYMANYPEVINAGSALAEAEKQHDEGAKTSARKRRDKGLETAFEDQLVQKIMPKLRGIETSGKQNEYCLKPIQRLLEDGGYTIIEDYKNALNFGDGQFIWNSSDYLYASEDIDTTSEQTDE